MSRPEKMRTSNLRNVELTPAEHKKRAEYQAEQRRLRRLRRTPEEHQEHREHLKRLLLIRLQGLTQKEYNELHRERLLALRIARSTKELEERHEVCTARNLAWTRLQSSVEYRRAYYAALTPEEKSERKAKSAARRAAWSPGRKRLESIKSVLRRDKRLLGSGE